MRVLMIHNFYQIPGGEDSIVRAEMSLLEQNGVEVDLFSATNDVIKGRLAQARAAFQVVYNPSARRAVAKKLAEFAPDVVHIHNFFPLLSPSIFDACRDAGVPSVITLHNYRILCPTAFLGADDENRERSLHQTCWWTVPKKAYRNSTAGTLALATMVEFHKRTGTWKRKVDRFIALTECAKHTFTEGGLPAERISVKPNWVPGPPGPDQTERKGGLFVGRLDDQKGIKVLLQAWKDLDCPLTIIGDGPLVDLVRQSVSDRIVYLGRQPQQVVQQQMQAAQFLVLPSMGHEMFPVTVLEAYASQLPVICSDLPSIAELVETGVTGLKFAPGDARGLASRVRWATRNATSLDQYGRRARSIYEQRYTPEVSFANLIGIYRSVCRDHALSRGNSPARRSAATGLHGHQAVL
jgi:glycosyltransferase involved in cell wall biosynthesis